MKAVVTRITLICLSLVLISLFFADSSYAKIDPANVAGLWLFDEGEGDEVEDSSGNGNHGSILGSKGKWVDGKFGSALELDGSNHVSVPDSDSLDMSDQITVMFWFYSEKKMADMWVDRQVIVGKSHLEYDIGIYMDGQIHTYTSDGAGSYDEGIMASMAGMLPDKEREWELGKWYHIAWTLDVQSEAAYVNGIKIGDHTKANPETTPGANPLEIGHRVGGSLPLVGAVDEVIVLNTVLEEEDILFAAEQGLEKALGITAVSLVDRLTTTWGFIKEQ